MLFIYSKMSPATPSQRRLLYAGGIFNLAAAASLALLARLSPHWLGLDPLVASQLAYVDLFAALVLAFGWGYALGGFDLLRFWPFVAMGVLAKGMVVALILGNFALGHAAVLPALLACCDALFACLFYRLLRQQGSR